jgi:hypothetical protein
MKTAGTMAAALDMTKTLEKLRPVVMQPTAVEAFQALALPASFGVGIDAALRDSPRVEPAALARRIGEAAGEAVALAETEDVAVVVDQSIGRVEGMTPARRKMLANDVVLLVAGFLTLAGFARGVNELKVAGAALAFAAALVRVYWPVR